VYINIPGKPIPQQRHRLFRRYGRSMIFDPCSKEKKAVKKIIQDQFIHEKIQQFVNPHVEFQFYFPYPAKLRKLKHKIIRHNIKPDVDNLIKFYLDCMNGIVYEDDKTVSIGRAIKLCGPIQPSTHIKIEERSLEVDACGF
jgi:Holliday junction resolvase RusA-like endonuclease